jgi:cytoskeletal protein CcmA (bactofilin family)
MEPTSAAPDNDQADALETPEGNVATVEESTSTPANQLSQLSTSQPAANSSESPAPKSSRLKQLLPRFNIYLFLFGLILMSASTIIVIAYLQSQKNTITNNIQTQELTQSSLQQVANSDASVGSSQQILNVESSAVFAGQILARQNLEVAGNLQVGGTLALNNISANGTGQFGEVTISKNLSVDGDSGLQGSLTIAKSLQVNGTASFSGNLSAPQLTTPSLQLNGDLVLTHHISVGGSTPSRSQGSALGGGGTASISGSDSAGSININTGSSPAAGCFITINFATKFSATPHVIVSPVGSSAAGLAYYVTRSSTSFSICTNSPAPASSSFGFDYFVVG